MLLLLFKALEFLNVVRFLSFKIPIFIARVPSVDFIKLFFSISTEKDLHYRGGRGGGRGSCCHHIFIVLIISH